MLILKRTDSNDPDFIAMVKLLDADLHQRDGTDHTFYAQFNKIDMIRHAIVGYMEGLDGPDDRRPVACGAIKLFEPGVMEVKRMYTSPVVRGKGVATGLLKALEEWARELGMDRCVLETGRRNPEAIALYEKSGYRLIDNYGQYAGVENSVCYEKQLI